MHRLRCNFRFGFIVRKQIQTIKIILTNLYINKYNLKGFESEHNLLSL